MDQVNRQALISHAITRADHGLISSEPRQRPGESDGGREVIVIAVVEFGIGIRGSLADRLNSLRGVLWAFGLWALSMLGAALYVAYQAGEIHATITGLRTDFAEMKAPKKGMNMGAVALIPSRRSWIT